LIRDLDDAVRILREASSGFSAKEDASFSEVMETLRLYILDRIRSGSTRQLSSKCSRPWSMSWLRAMAVSAAR